MTRSLGLSFARPSLPVATAFAFGGLLTAAAAWAAVDDVYGLAVVLAIGGMVGFGLALTIPD